MPMFDTYIKSPPLKRFATHHKALLAFAGLLTFLATGLIAPTAQAQSNLPANRKEASKNDFDIRKLISEAEAKFSANSQSPAPSTSSSTNAFTSGNGENPVLHFGSELVLQAMTLLGINYKFGGNTPDTGFDCSGFVRYVFKEAFGHILPRRSEDISQKGQRISVEQLVPGDLVFFNTLKKTFSHVGIYIGNNQFVHAPSSGSGVRVESIDKNYWQARFDGARRVLISAPSAAAPVGTETEPKERRVVE
jgi:cell wall-associated NlpC family hydrolase